MPTSRHHSCFFFYCCLVNIPRIQICCCSEDQNIPWNDLRQVGGVRGLGLVRFWYCFCLFSNQENSHSAVVAPYKGIKNWYWIWIHTVFIATATRRMRESGQNRRLHSSLLFTSTLSCFSSRSPLRKLSYHLNLSVSFASISFSFEQLLKQWFLDSCFISPGLKTWSSCIWTWLHFGIQIDNHFPNLMS